VQTLYRKGLFLYTRKPRPNGRGFKFISERTNKIKQCCQLSERGIMTGVSLRLRPIMPEIILGASSKTRATKPEETYRGTVVQAPWVIATLYVGVIPIYSSLTAGMSLREQISTHRYLLYEVGAYRWYLNFEPEVINKLQHGQSVLEASLLSAYTVYIFLPKHIAGTSIVFSISSLIL